MNFTKKSISVIFLTYILTLSFNHFYKIYIDRNYDYISLNLINKHTFFKDYFLLYIGILISILYFVINIFEVKSSVFCITKNTFLIICLVCLIAFFCNFLEQINFYGLSSSTSEIINKPVTNVDIKQKIIALPEYQGDSLIITADGKIESKDGLIQSYIHQMYSVPANLESLTNIAKSKKEPLAVYIYLQSIVYYSQTYPDKVKKINEKELR